MGWSRKASALFLPFVQLIWTTLASAYDKAVLWITLSPEKFKVFRTFLSIFYETIGL